MQIEVMGHDGGADDADGEIEHLRIAQDLGIRQEAPGKGAERRMRQAQLIGEAAGDDGQQQADGIFRQPPAGMRQAEQGQGEAGRQDHAGCDGKPEQKLERHGRPQQLGHIRRHHGNLGGRPADQRQRTRQALADEPGQILARRQGEANGENLQEGRRQAGGQHHEEQSEAVARPGGHIRRPIAGIDIAHRHHIPRPQHRQPPAQRQGRRAIPQGGQAGDESGHGRCG